MRRLIHSLILGLALVGEASAQSLTPAVSGPLAAPPTSARPDLVIPLEPWRSRWVATAEVAGVRRRLLFDTGGGNTHLTPTAARASGCRPRGRLAGFNMMGVRLESQQCDGLVFNFGGRSFKPPVVGLLDLGASNPRDAELDGLLALDMFEDRAVTLDLRGGHIVLESPASLVERTARMTPIPIRLARETGGRALAVYVQVSSPEGPMWFEFDSGNGGTILVSAPNAAAFGLDAKAPGPQKALIRLSPEVELRTEFAYTPDITIDGNLGMPFLREWIVTVDFPSSRAWIAPAWAGKPDEV